MTSFYGKGVRERVCPSVHPSVRSSVMLLAALARSVEICDGAQSTAQSVFHFNYYLYQVIFLGGGQGGGGGGGWSDVAKVLCILRHRGVQLILAYSWARPAILVAGKGRGGMFLFLLFLRFHSCSSFFPVPLSHLLNYLFYLFSPVLWEMTQNDPQGLTCH